jgi:hypothetical protein
VEVVSVLMGGLEQVGASDRAAASASPGQVKNLAEKPLFCSMPASVDTLTCPSSATTMRES